MIRIKYKCDNTVYYRGVAGRIKVNHRGGRSISVTLTEEKWTEGPKLIFTVLKCCYKYLAPASRGMHSQIYCKIAPFIDQWNPKILWEVLIRFTGSTRLFTLEKLHKSVSDLELKKALFCAMLCMRVLSLWHDICNTLAKITGMNLPLGPEHCLLVYTH